MPIISQPCEISSFRHSVDKVFACVGCYAANVGSCLLTFWDSLSGPILQLLWLIDRLFQNIVQQLPTYIVQQPRTVKNSLILVLHRKETGCPDCRSPVA
jgi:hypothetical protein